MYGAQNHFRFRLISRGEVANTLTRLSVCALQWCHPKIRVTVIDANDTPQLREEDFPDSDLIHIVPGDDAVAQKVGRGSRKHLYYWRHSPEVLSAIPRDAKFVAYMDSDIIFIRPMDLSSLIEPLRKGRIGVAVDESLISYTNLIQERVDAVASIFAMPGTCGPLLQGGLVFSNANDDGNFFKEFWKLAKIAAEENILDLLPFDDMSLLTSLLTNGGQFWERWLALSPEWNFITAAGQDPGVFAVGAHFGGYRAKRFLLENTNQFMPSGNPGFAWGSTPTKFENGRWYFHRGLISSVPEATASLFRLDAPSALSWTHPDANLSFILEVRLLQGTSNVAFVYIDGKFHSKIIIKFNSQTAQQFHVNGGSVITLITAPDAFLCKEKATLCIKIQYANYNSSQVRAPDSA